MTGPAAPKPLHIAVVGAGQIGSTFAFQLARAGGHEVTVVARPGSPRLAQLRRDGGIVTRKGDRAAVRVLDALDESTSYDLVIVTLMAHQVDAVLPALRQSRAECVQFMFNVFEPERLAAAVGTERCSFGMPFVQARLDADGRLDPVIGAGGQKTLMGRQRWVDVFAAAGLPAALEPDMPLWLRCHAPLCVAFESVSVSGERRSGGVSWSEASILARGLKACFSLIEEQGSVVYPRSKRLMYRSPTAGVAAMLLGLSRIRSFRELLATGEAECCALVDDMVGAATSSNRLDLARSIAAMKPVNSALK
ncbi:ketopantoate reductase family protein [uncultured Sphingomonas sp.]|uniref:ketopantoate reductase family protein n=1 Tax=uncultured Sphingomonas sp. TaxID=158754 RepID=UPI0035C98BCB